MNVTSSSKDRSAEIDRCLSMIVPSASDESKFVGMLILPKLLDQNNTNDIERVFNGMNFKFIERLLRTRMFCFNSTSLLETDNFILTQIIKQMLKYLILY